MPTVETIPLADRKIKVTNKTISKNSLTISQL